MVQKNLTKCVEYSKRKEGATRSHLEARGEMLMASLMGAVAFQKGLGVTHSCAHALSTVCDLHHGLANAYMLPACLEFNKDAMSDRFSRITTVLGLGQNPDALVGWIKELKKQIGLSTNLRDAKVSEDHIEALVEIAEKDGCHACNSKKVSRSDFQNLFKAALGAN